MVKENANPQIFQVEKERISTRRTPLDWSQLGSFRTSNNVDDIEDEGVTGVILPPVSNHSSSSNLIVPLSAHDKAVLKALIDCHQSTNGKGVQLLRQAGLDIPVVSTQSNIVASGPVFRLAASTTSTIPSDISLQGSVATTTPMKKKRKAPAVAEEDALTAAEVFDIIRNIQDPEHPHTLEQLGVVSLEQVELRQDNGTTAMVDVRFTPTIPHCSMATLIGLCIRVKLWRSLPSSSGKFKVSVQIEPGTHVSENAINKQLRDKERVCAALENKHLAGVVNKCIRNGMNGES
jgi:metal-sulfur cluster biosynthetic enzyme